jgi:uncharacterized protein (DUF58 family)
MASPATFGVERSALNVAAADWHGPGVKAARRPFSWHGLLWKLVFPPRRHRIGLTVPGLFLMVTAMGIGTAAYNTANNILFITLSLLLACLLLSGLLSWFNLMGVCWRLRPQGPWRAGHEALVSVEVQNRKRWLPSYSLWFELSTQPTHPPAETKPAAEMKIREVLAAIEKLVTRGQLPLRNRLVPGGETRLDWVVKPRERGETTVALDAVGSYFPFGFLKKSLGVGVKQTVLVWPAQIDYQWSGLGAAQGGTAGRNTTRAGTGDDLLALRKYAQGDSHRLIHWKASARLGRLMVRQFANESLNGFVIRLDTPAEVWTRPEQFELLCSLAGSLAEDLFAAGQLRGVSVNGGPLIETRRLREVEGFLDELAKVRPGSEPGAGSREQGASKNVITFAPEGARGVTAYVDGQPAASA